MKYDLTADGGGVRGTALVGAVSALESRGFTLSHAAGTSAGSIVCALAAAGYTSSELRRILFDMDFRTFLDGSKFPPARWATTFRHYGMYKGDSFYEWIKELLAEKGVHTFHDLISDDPDEQQTFKYRWRLKVIASDVSNSRMIKLPTDAQLYGLEPDDMEVATAVRMSMSIPFFFRPMIFKTTQVANLPYVPKWLRPTVNKNNYIVDGGLLSNFPIWMWDSDGTPDWPTFGLLLSDKSDTQPNEVDGLMSFFVAIFKTMMKAHDKRFIKPEDYFHRTIAIPTGQIMSTDFNIVNAEKELLYQSGYTAAITFLDNWKWEDYRKWAIKQRGL